MEDPMRLWPTTTAHLWQKELTPMLGGWVMVFLRGGPALPIPLTGRVVRVDGTLVHLSQIGNEYIVSLADIHYIMKPGPNQQEELTISAMSPAGTKKEA
jgi:hypothetical protein